MVTDRIGEALREATVALGAGDARFRLDRPKDAKHGDLATNVAEEIVFLVEGHSIKHSKSAPST